MTATAGLGAVPSVSTRALVERAWKAGFLGYLLLPYQIEVYATFWRLIHQIYRQPTQAGDYRVGSLLAVRKMGKSFIESLVAHEFAMRYPGAKIRIGAPTGVEARDVFYPEFEKLHELAPRSARPRKTGIDGNWRCPNGSVIYLRGLDMFPDRARGPGSDLNLLDEAAYIDRLMYVVNRIYIPMTRRSKGVTLLCSTRSEMAASEFNAFHERCEALGQAATVDVYHAGFTQAEIESERASVDEITWAIEYECKPARSTSYTVIPEWTADAIAACVAEPPTDDLDVAHWHRFTALDFGTQDNTALLSAYFDFRHQRVYVTDERILNGADVMASNIAAKGREMEAQDAAARPMAPTCQLHRVGDNNIEMLQTLSFDQNYAIEGIGAKDFLETMVALVRTYIRQGRLIVSPKCVNLLACLAHATWAVRAVRPGAPQRRVFARSELTDANGVPLRHFDALATLVYLILYIERQKDENPLPVTYVTPAQVAAHGPYGVENYMTTWNNSQNTAPLAGPAWLPNSAQRRRRST